MKSERTAMKMPKKPMTTVWNSNHKDGSVVCRWAFVLKGHSRVLVFQGVFVEKISI